MNGPNDASKELPHAAPRDVDCRELQAALNHSRQALLAARNVAGHWTGKLSSSALSTATAIVALTLHQRAAENLAARQQHQPQVDAGLAWLRQNQNADGGWGDTTLSISNISTTTLCWAAIGLHLPTDDAVCQSAAAWLRRTVGSLEPPALAAAIARRYGRDRTFSVPILTMCVLAGRFGDGRQAWKLVPKLPFELAAFPQWMFRFLRLPVVSYALPALIAIGLVRHRRGPNGNWLSRMLRSLTTRRTLSVLQQIQPQGGGFLEATPLTSFVSMSLIGAGLSDHPVVRQSIDFLLREIRADGSWPIDTNLATWVTTLAVNALSNRPSASATQCAPALSEQDRTSIASWLLAQHYRQRHPYTGAAPGGWAWTNLPGGVPDADDTAGALIALRHLAVDSAESTGAAQAGVDWLLDLQNRDGGLPTFCRGWGVLPFDRSGADLTAHALHAWHAWSGELRTVAQQRIRKATARALEYLAKMQTADGAWSPLWFGNQFATGDENLVYGTSRVLAALNHLDAAMYPRIAPLAQSATRWLLAAQQPDGLWGGNSSALGSIEETALAIVALTGSKDRELATAVRATLDRGVAALLRATAGGTTFPPSPIGFYFAKLWYFEELYPVIWTVAALESAARPPASA